MSGRKLRNLGKVRGARVAGGDLDIDKSVYRRFNHRCYTVDLGDNEEEFMNCQFSGMISKMGQVTGAVSAYCIRRWPVRRARRQSERRMQPNGS